MSDFLDKYGSLPESLSSPVALSQVLLGGCQADTSDCSTDTCGSECPDCYDYPCSSDCPDSPTPKYTIWAKVNFNASGGSVSPASATGYSYNQTLPYGNVSVTFPTPTRSGYVFLYWLLDGYVTHWPAGANSIYATEGGETYTARAQWEKAQGTGFLLDDGNKWLNAVPYIDDGFTWIKYVSNLDHNGSWEGA